MVLRLCLRLQSSLQSLGMSYIDKSKRSRMFTKVLDDANPLVDSLVDIMITVELSSHTCAYGFVRQAPPNADLEFVDSVPAHLDSQLADNLSDDRRALVLSTLSDRWHTAQSLRGRAGAVHRAHYDK